MGWDSFGLPAEQYAVKTGQHPRVTTEANIANFTRQIKSLGFSYDWSRELATTDPDYFKWTQWIFLKLYNSWFNPETNKAEPISTLKYPEDLQLSETQASRRAGRRVQASKARILGAQRIDATSTEAETSRAYRDSKRLAYVSEAPVNWCPELGTVLGQRGSHRRQERGRRLPGHPQADAPMDAPHHRLRRETAGRSRHDRLDRFAEGNAAELDRP